MTARWVFLLIMFVCSSVTGAQSPSPLSIKVVPPSRGALFLGYVDWAIYLDGEIDKHAAQRLSTEIESNNIRYATVYLNSPGGDLLGGIQLGRLIRKHRFSTRIGTQRLDGVIKADARCISACALAFVGGYFRYQDSGSVIGVQRFSLREPDSADLELAQIVSATITAHLTEMRVDVSLFKLMSRVRKDDTYLLTPDEATRLRVVNNGKFPAKWSIRSNVPGTLYLRGVQETRHGVGKVIFACHKGKVLFYPMYYVSNAKALAESTRQLSIRLDGEFVALEPSGPLESSGGVVSALFDLPPELVSRLEEVDTIGFAGRPENPGIFWGFNVDTAGAKEKISSYLSNCQPNR